MLNVFSFNFDFTEQAYLLLCVPYQSLTLLTMLLKLFLSCASCSVSVVLIPISIARL